MSSHLNYTNWLKSFFSSEKFKNEWLNYRQHWPLFNPDVQGLFNFGAQLSPYGEFSILKAIRIAIDVKRKIKPHGRLEKCARTLDRQVEAFNLEWAALGIDNNTPFEQIEQQQIMLNNRVMWPRQARTARLNRRRRGAPAPAVAQGEEVEALQGERAVDEEKVEPQHPQGQKQQQLQLPAAIGEQVEVEQLPSPPYSPSLPPPPPTLYSDEDEEEEDELDAEMQGLLNARIRSLELKNIREQLNLEMDYRAAVSRGFRFSAFFNAELKKIGYTENDIQAMSTPVGALEKTPNTL